jgi:hypothetical protein
MEIVHTYSFMTSNWFWLLILMFMTFLFVSLMIYNTIDACKSENKWKEFIIGTLAAFAIFGAPVTFGWYGIWTEPYVHHLVKIDDMSKFDHDKYKIIKHKDGNVFKVRKKVE